jgi:NAD(P)-dependent dehydrogenase (short-subunit alcohol dehydrogenase family)
MNSALADDALAGKNAFIAGGTSGINLGIARRMAKAGAKLVLLGRNPEKAEAAAASIRADGGTAVAHAGDVRDYAAMEAAMAHADELHGELDIVIAGQAGNFVAPALGISSNGFKTVVEIDLIGSFHVFKASFPHLRRPGASLIAITAGQAVSPTLFQAHVCAAKAGVNMLIKCLAMEWGSGGVRVNGISPGPINGTEGMARLTPTPEAEAAMAAKIPLRRYGELEDIAEMAVFLCTESARYITGTILDVEGGSQLGDASLYSVP